VAQLPVRRPLGEAHLGHQPRLHPARIAQPGRPAGGAAGPGIAGEIPLQVLALPGGEAGPHLSRELVAALPVRHRQQKSAQRPRSVPLARRPAHDRQLLAGLRLQLQPVAGAALLVDRAARLEDQAFHPPLLHALERRPDVARHLLRQPHRVRRVGEHAAEEIPPLLQRPLSQVLAVQPQEIEGEEHRLLRRPLLDQLEARHARGVQHADLPVDHRVAHHQAGEGLGHPGKAGRKVESVARPHRHPPAGERAERPVPVVLHLRVPIAGRRLVHQGGEHGRQVGGEDRFRPRPRRAQLPAPLRPPGEHPPAHHRFRPLGDHVVPRLLRAVLGLEHQPLRLARLAAVGAHEVPLAAQLVPAELHHDVAPLPLLGELPFRHRIAGAVVPDERVARAVLPVRDPALEAAVLQRVVLGLDGQPLDRRIVAGSLGHRPRGQSAVHLQAHVVVQAGGIVLVDHERRLRVIRLRPRGGLRGDGEVALRLVLGEPALQGRSLPPAGRAPACG